MVHELSLFKLVVAMMLLITSSTLKLGFDKRFCHEEDRVTSTSIVYYKNGLIKLIELIID